MQISTRQGIVWYRAGPCIAPMGTSGVDCSGGSGWVQVCQLGVLSSAGAIRLGSRRWVQRLGLGFRLGSGWVQVLLSGLAVGVQVGFSYSICKNTAFPHHRYRNAASSCIEKPYILQGRKLAYRIMSHYIILYTVLYCVDTGGNELAPWVHRCCFFGFSLGPGLAVWGSGWVQVGFRFRLLGSGWVLSLGFRFRLLGSGWVQVWRFLVQVGFRRWVQVSASVGSGWVQVGYKFGSWGSVWFRLGAQVLAFGVQVGFRWVRVGFMGFKLGP